MQKLATGAKRDKGGVRQPRSQAHSRQAFGVTSHHTTENEAARKIV